MMAAVLVVRHVAQATLSSVHSLPRDRELRRLWTKIEFALGAALFVLHHFAAPLPTDSPSSCACDVEAQSGSFKPAETGGMKQFKYLNVPVADGDIGSVLVPVLAIDRVIV